MRVCQFFYSHYVILYLIELLIIFISQYTMYTFYLYLLINTIRMDSFSFPFKLTLITSSLSYFLSSNVAIIMKFLINVYVRFDINPNTRNIYLESKLPSIVVINMEILNKCTEYFYINTNILNIYLRPT